MNSDLTFITPSSRAKLAMGQANENSIRQTDGVLGGNGACAEHSRSV